MSKHRTRSQKIASQVKKLEVTAQESPTLAAKITSHLRQDLTTSAVVTILALFLQVAFAIYLNKYGGWKIFFERG